MFILLFTRINNEQCLVPRQTLFLFLTIHLWKKIKTTPKVFVFELFVVMWKRYKFWFNRLKIVHNKINTLWYIQSFLNTALCTIIFLDFYVLYFECYWPFYFPKPLSRVLLYAFTASRQLKNELIQRVISYIELKLMA